MQGGEESLPFWLAEEEVGIKDEFPRQHREEVYNL